MYPAIGCAPLKSLVTVSYYIVYLPEGGGSRTLTIFKSVRSGVTTSPCTALRTCGYVYVIYNVYCYSSEDRFENEDQMETVIKDVEMFMTRNKQGLALNFTNLSRSGFWLKLRSFLVAHVLLIRARLEPKTKEESKHLDKTTCFFSSSDSFLKFSKLPTLYVSG